ncbi:ABC transporter permease, partial [Escherichia coli]|nr:ABC transporter permease [Escherichia coli]
AVKSGELDSYLLLSLNDKQLPQAVYKANSLAESNLSSTLEQAVQQTKVAMATVKIGLEEKQIDQLYSPVSFKKEALVENAKT